MSTFEDAKRLFLSVRDLPPAERAARLAGADSAVRREVESLLSHDAAPAAALDQPQLGQGLKALVDDALASAPPPEPPERIGRYRVVRMIGQGGMGVVYEAEQEDPRRRVALKVIRPGVVTPQLLRRFRYEAQVLGQLRHPGIAAIYEAGAAEGGQPFFAMELVDGEPLLGFAASRGLGLPDRLELIARVCDALHHAHTRGVIHRDLKPANILVEPAPADETSATDSSTTTRAAPGMPKILDFGVARATDADVHTVTMPTDSGQLVGTLAYMSPEQASGDTMELDVRSDVYALGVIAYELLAGRLPYAVQGRPIHEIVAVIRDEAPSSLRAVDRGLRGDVETIVAKALAKEKSERYQSVAEMGADIRRHLRDEPIVARPPSSVYQLRKFAQRNRTLVAVVSVAAIALMAVTVAAVRQAVVANHLRSVSQTQTIAAVRQAYRATIVAAAAALDGGDPITARQLLDAVGPDDRAWEWAHLVSRLDDASAIVTSDAPVVCAGFDHQGDRVITITSTGVIEWRDVADPTRVPTRRDELGAVVTAALSRDGRSLLTVDPLYRTARLWRLDHSASPEQTAEIALPEVAAPAPCTIALADNGRFVMTLRAELLHGDPDRGVFAQETMISRFLELAISSDGSRRLVAMSSPPHRRLFDYAPDGTRRLTWRRPRYPTHVACAASGTGTALCGADKIVRYDAAGDGRESIEFSGHRGTPTALAMTDAGDRIASAATDGTIRLHDVAAAQTYAVLGGHEDAITSLRFSPDGTHLVSVGTGGEARLWSTAAVDATSVLAGDDSFIYDLVFTPDGEYLYAGGWGGNIVVFRADGGARVGSVQTNRDAITSMAMSPDGAVLATGHGGRGSGRVRIWRAETLEFITEVDADGGQAAAVAFDDTHLFTRGDSGALIAWRLGVWTEQWRAECAPRREADIAVSPATGLLAVTGRTGVELRDADGGELVRTLTDDGTEMDAVAFDQPGTRIAAGGADGVLRIWDTTTGALLRRLEGHASGVYSLAFDASGTRLASGSDDNAVRVWDPESGESVLRLDGHADYVHAVAFRPGGTLLASGSGDETVRLWDTRPLHARLDAARATGAERTFEVPLAPGIDGDPFDGAALAFEDANQFVNVGDDESFRLADTWTIEAWIRPATRLPDEPSFGAIVTREGEYQLNWREGRIWWTVAADDDLWLNWMHSRCRVPHDTWTHVAMVRTPDELRILLNGRLDSRLAMTGPLGDQHAEDDLRIGNRAWSDQHFRGLIDEVRIWAVARTDSEIMAWMRESLPGDEPDLLGYWRFDEGAGDVARDATGRHDGSLSGGVAWQATSRSH